MEATEALQIADDAVNELRRLRAENAQHVDALRLYADRVTELGAELARCKQVSEAQALTTIRIENERAALNAENARLRLRLSECADELARLDRYTDNAGRVIRADASAALAGSR